MGLDPSRVTDPVLLIPRFQRLLCGASTLTPHLFTLGPTRSFIYYLSIHVFFYANLVLWFKRRLWLARDESLGHEEQLLEGLERCVFMRLAVCEGVPSSAQALSPGGPSIPGQTTCGANNALGWPQIGPGRVDTGHCCVDYVHFITC